MSSPAENLSTVQSVVATTIVCVNFAKKLVSPIPWLASLPIWLYAVLISSVLTILANRVFHTLDGSLSDLVYQSVTNAAMASGVFEWLNNHDKPISETGLSKTSLDLTE